MSVGGLSHPLFPNPDEINSYSRMQRRMRGDEPTQEARDDVSGACRNLFGPVVDPQEKAQSQLEKLKAAQRERWNFDFDTETPLPGRYQWVRVQSATLRNGDCDIDPSDPGRASISSHKKAEDETLPSTTAQPTEQASQGGGAARGLKQAEVTRYLKIQKCKRCSQTEKNRQSSGSSSSCPPEVLKNCITSLTIPKLSHFSPN